MQEQLLNHINRYALCKTTDKILLAVSGGLDSVVMFHLLREAGFTVGVAHCNFQLRGEEASTDEAFVRALCQGAGVPCFVKRFDTGAYAERQGISIQMAARDLRYAWFAQLLKEEAYDVLATAHHHSDVIESVMLNLIRGTGIDGFRGIAVKKGEIIRPLLFATRRMISTYAREKHIEWREDASNASDDYQRNYVRHQVIPRLEEMNPSFELGFADTQERILGAREIMQVYLSNFRNRAVEVVDGGRQHVEVGKIQEGPSPAVVLWELIKDLGFGFDQCRKIVLTHQPGKIFHSSSHQLLVDRTHYIIERRQPSQFTATTIEEGQHWAGHPPFMLSLERLSSDDFELKRDSSIAQLDLERLQFPLVWRKWQAGDYFTPLGMKHEKKLSDFLIDLKIPFNNKADVTVLESGNEIVWVVGFRISDRFKVTDKTRKVLIVAQQQERP